MIPRDIRFAWTDAQGNLVISQCGDGVFFPGIEDHQAIDLAASIMKAAGTMPADAEPVPILKEDLPEDRAYREAWTLVDGVIEIDLTKKAEIDARNPVRIDLSFLLEKLTRDEKAAAGTFMMSNPAMMVDMMEAAARGDFRADNPDTGRFTQALIDAQVVTPQRLAELLS